MGLSVALGLAPAGRADGSRHGHHRASRSGKNFPIVGILLPFPRSGDARETPCDATRVPQILAQLSNG